MKQNEETKKKIPTKNQPKYYNMKVVETPEKKERKALTQIKAKKT